MSRSTVLFVVHSARTGGAQLMALAAAERLGRVHDLLIAIPRAPLRSEFAAHGEFVRASPSLPFGNPSRFRWALKSARSVLDGIRLAVLVRRRGVRVILTNSTVLLSPVLAGRLARVPTIVHARETAGFAAEAHALAVIGRLADEVIAVSDAVAAEFRPSTALRRIADGVAIPPEAPPPTAFSQPLRISLIGTINADRRKGHDLAIQSLARTVRAGIDARLDCVGPIHDDGVAEELRALASALGIAERVTLSGPTRDIDAVYARTDVLLSCAHREPLGLTLMEALVRHTPVIATRAGGPEEILRQGETGILVEDRDPEAVARAIATLVADPDSAQRMARRGRLDMIERFDREDGLDRLTDEVTQVACQTR